MIYEELVKKYRTATAIADAFGVARNTPLYWKSIGYIPIAAQVRIERLSGGEFKADLSHVRI